MCDRPLRNDEHIGDLDAFIELIRLAGIQYGEVTGGTDSDTNS